MINPFAIIRKTRQPVSGLTHLGAALLAGFGLYWIWPEGGLSGWSLFSVLVFGISMIVLFVSSSLYHLLPLSERKVLWLRKIDHSTIYIFIAGCYTPVCLMLLADGSGPAIAITIWSIAFVGVIVKLFWIERSRWFRIALYLGMGWVMVALLPELWAHLSGGALGWLLAEGAVYTIGALVYATRWPNPVPERFGFHEIWHVFVVAGCFCHYWFVKAYLLA